MNLKGLNYDYRPVHLLKGAQFADEYAALNPSKQVPTLIHDGRAVAQSVAIIDYLDGINAEPRLFPVDAYARALVMQACEIVNSGVQPFGNTATMRYLKDVLGLDETARNAWLMQWLGNGSRTLEKFLAPHAGTYAFGDSPTAADCFVQPHLFGCSRFNVPFDDCPTLTRLAKTYMANEAIAAAHPSKQPDFES